MADTEFLAFADRATLLDTDALLVVTSGGVGMNVPGSAIVKRSAAGNAGGEVEVDCTGPAVMSLTNHLSTQGQIVGGIRFNSRAAPNGWYAGVDGRIASNAAGVDQVDLCFASFGAIRARFSGATFRPEADNSSGNGTAAFRWNSLFVASGVVSTSDRNDKQQIGAIPDEWLDAWNAVDWCRFRFNDAVALKGNGARWHFGLIAQDTRRAFDDAGIDALAIGLICFDRWDAESDTVMQTVTKTRKVQKMVMVPIAVDGHPGAVVPELVEVDEEYTETEPTGETVVTRDAGERWGIRYDLAQAIEAAWQRRRGDRAEAMLAALTERVAALEV